MIKKSLLRRIAIATSALVILLILYFFPTNLNIDEDDFLQQLVYTNETEKNSIYLIDQNNYVARANMFINAKETDELIKGIIEALIINGRKQNYVPNGFKPIIPAGTTLKSHSLDGNGLLKVDFSKEILNVKLENEEKMIEAIVYSLTTITDVKKIMIFVEEEQLKELPHSKKRLPTTLDRSYGINKTYDLDSFKNATATVVYYIGRFNANYYFVPVTYVSNSTVSKVEIIINELRTSPIRRTNLMSYLATNTQLLNYEITEEKINMSFNKYLLESFEDRSILEEVKYTIALSIKANFNVSELVFNVDNEKIMSIPLKQLNN